MIDVNEVIRISASIAARREGIAKLTFDLEAEQQQLNDLLAGKMLESIGCAAVASGVIASGQAVIAERPAKRTYAKPRYAKKRVIKHRNGVPTLRGELRKFIRGCAAPVDFDDIIRQFPTRTANHLHVELGKAIKARVIRRVRHGVYEGT